MFRTSFREVKATLGILVLLTLRFSLWSEEDVSAKVRAQFDGNRQADIAKELDEHYGPDAKLTERNYEFLLAITQHALSYSLKTTELDYSLLLRASKRLIQAGDKSLTHQGVLLNYMAQDSTYLRTLSEPDFAACRKETSELLLSVYTLARGIVAGPAPKSKTATPNFQIPVDLAQEMIDQGGQFDPNGAPIPGTISPALQKRHDALVADHKQDWELFRKRFQAERVLRESNNVIIVNYFVSRYSRPPFDYHECNRYIQSLAVSNDLRIKIIREIADITITVPPKEIDPEFKVNQGDADF